MVTVLDHVRAATASCSVNARCQGSPKSSRAEPWAPRRAWTMITIRGLLARAPGVPDRMVISGESRSITDISNRRSAAACQLRRQVHDLSSSVRLTGGHRQNTPV
jgi:hypothetical protein